jgi:hypothetical protein
MEPKTIILGVVVMIILYLLYSYYFSDGTSTTLVNLHDATQALIIPADRLPGGVTSDYTFSIWIYVNSWATGYGQPKTIFERKDTNGNVCPSVVLDPNINNIVVNTAVYGKNQQGLQVSPCTLENVPIQKWTNIIITINNRALDLYLDGKLVRTCVLPGVPMVNPQTPVSLSPGGMGFSGYTSNFKYYARTVNPREAYAIYREGYGGGGFMSNLLNKYRVKLSFMKGNQEMSSFQL